MLPGRQEGAPAGWSPPEDRGKSAKYRDYATELKTKKGI